MSALIRTTLFVRERKRAKAFYHNLGITEVYFEGILDHPSACSVLGFNDVASYPVSILKVPGPNFGMLGLFELPDTVSEQAVRTGAATTGESAQVFYVTDFDTVLPKLKAAGATWLPAPTTFELGHFKHREICLRDCDGFLVNLIERDPAQQALCAPELEFTSLDDDISL